MKMAKASQADIEAGMALAAALSTIEKRFDPTDDDEPRISLDDPVTCQRLLRHLLAITKDTSLMRVTWGMQVLLDPENAVVDPSADTLELHPRFAAQAAAPVDAGAAVAPSEALAELRAEMRPLNDEQALLTLWRENKRLRADAAARDGERERAIRDWAAEAVSHPATEPGRSSREGGAAGYWLTASEIDTAVALMRSAPAPAPAVEDGELRERLTRLRDHLRSRRDDRIPSQRYDEQHEFRQQVANDIDALLAAPPKREST